MEDSKGSTWKLVKALERHSPADTMILDKMNEMLDCNFPGCYSNPQGHEDKPCDCAILPSL